MNLEPREIAAAESYPTFWVENEPATASDLPPVPAEAAYEAFVNLCEDDLPEVVTQNAE